MSIAASLFRKAVDSFIQQIAARPSPVRVTLVIGGIETKLVDLSPEAVGAVFESARTQKVQLVAEAGGKSVTLDLRSGP